ncbi:phge_HK97_gp10, phage protein, HK97 gp10 family [uncultured Caudovirales phage]|uniref:Phge_HK97_gp10, phage protein, HK97 gp10 family n=1 Tax=uncultured Caudovirales phage TaxID=2100421 RepID=A0A6J5T717_9CAUD|nr:phge_HK97_gp10, phage protein, HK97 gp10 family [uncultured Caudovirales phage]CAB4210800.1 phge_HK97_gp10, phage protein, HK97 gp10 family [uncultured Caudovirales phage]CAB4223328.1 phge_HK97_gp10, phage protein, HK97 gp10 family [uncultured Caudovirales phage]
MIGKDALKKRLKTLGEQSLKEVRIALNSAALAVERTAKTSVQRGTKSGRIYKRKGIVHRASAPGEPPASDTGYLAAHITTVLDLDGLGANVESQAEYSRYLEFGTAKMGARPFLFPAFEQNKDRIKANLSAAIKRALKG